MVLTMLSSLEGQKCKAKNGWLIDGLLEQAQGIARSPKMEPKGLVR